MIDPDYVRTMARYNAWQNRQLTEMLTGVSDDVLRADRGAFFGSIFETLNHLLWGDTLWMSRFTDAVAPPAVPADQHRSLTPTFAVWSAERFRMDGAIIRWADKLRAVELQGQLRWYSGLLKTHNEKPVALCVMQLFNHQTHHRGQVHAMMTAAGLKAPVTDIPFMPEDAT